MTFTLKYLIGIGRLNALLLFLVSFPFIDDVLCDDKVISISESNFGRNYTPGELIFADEFDSFNLETWRHENTLGTKNWEFQMYTNSRTISYVQDGILFIKPALTSDVFGVDYLYNGQWDLGGSYPENICTDISNWGCTRSGHYPYLLNPIMSARLSTTKSFYFKYGRVETRAKIPSGDWIWPAMWMMPRFNAYGPWPISGEIDIMESRGNRKLYDPVTWKNYGSEMISSTLHFGPHWPHDAWERATSVANSPPGKGFDLDFHVYGLNWTDEKIEFSIDGNVTNTIRPNTGGFFELGGFNNVYANPWKHSGNSKMAPFDQKFYLILNVAVGGVNFFPDHWVNKNGKKPWMNNSPFTLLPFYEGRMDWGPTWVGDAGALQIDYVRVYAV